MVSTLDNPLPRAEVIKAVERKFHCAFPWYKPSGGEKVLQSSMERPCGASITSHRMRLFCKSSPLIIKE